MARQIFYQDDNTIDERDRLTGIDSQDNSTKNFTIGDIAEFFANTGIADPTRLALTYTVDTGSSSQPGTGELNYGLITEDNRVAEPPAGIDTIYINRFDNRGRDALPLFRLMRGGTIKLVNNNDINNVNYAIYAVRAISNNDPYLTLTVTHIGSQGEVSPNGEIASVTLLSGQIPGIAAVRFYRESVPPATGFPDGVAPGDYYLYFHEVTERGVTFEAVDLYGPYTLDGWGEPTRLTGQVGATGPRGDGLRVENVQPGNTTTDTTFDIVEFDFQDNVVSTTEITAPHGPQGAQGDPGGQGDQGFSVTNVSATGGTMLGEATTIQFEGNDPNNPDVGNPITIQAGVQGERGATGATGMTGPQGDAATITAGTATTVAAGLGPNLPQSTVTNSGTESAAIFDFTIPQGFQGIGIPANSTATSINPDGTIRQIQPGTNTLFLVPLTDPSRGSGGVNGYRFTVPPGAPGDPVDNVRQLANDPDGNSRIQFEVDGNDIGSPLTVQRGLPAAFSATDPVTVNILAHGSTASGSVTGGAQAMQFTFNIPEGAEGDPASEITEITYVVNTPTNDPNYDPSAPTAGGPDFFRFRLSHPNASSGTTTNITQLNNGDRSVQVGASSGITIGATITIGAFMTTADNVLNDVVTFADPYMGATIAPNTAGSIRFVDPPTTFVYADISSLTSEFITEQGNHRFTGTNEFRNDLTYTAFPAPGQPVSTTEVLTVGGAFNVAVDGTSIPNHNTVVNFMDTAGGVEFTATPNADFSRFNVTGTIHADGQSLAIEQGDVEAGAGQTITIPGESTVNGAINLALTGTNDTGYTLAASGHNILSQSSSIGDLANVDTTGVAANNILRYNGRSWVPTPDNDTNTFVTIAGVDAGGNANNVEGGQTINFPAGGDTPGHAGQIGFEITGTGNSKNLIATLNPTPLSYLSDVQTSSPTAGVSVLGFTDDGWGPVDQSALSITDGNNTASGRDTVTLETGATETGEVNFALSTDNDLTATVAGLGDLASEDSIWFNPDPNAADNQVGISDVRIISDPEDNQVLAYVAANRRWENRDAASTMGTMYDLGVAAGTTADPTANAAQVTLTNTRDESDITRATFTVGTPTADNPLGGIAIHERTGNIIEVNHGDTIGGGSSSEGNTGNTFIQNITLDRFGHINGISTGIATTGGEGTTYGLDVGPGTTQLQLLDTSGSEDNPVVSTVDFIAGDNVTIIRNGDGDLVFSATGGGGGGLPQYSFSPTSATQVSGPDMSGIPIVLVNEDDAFEIRFTTLLTGEPTGMTATVSSDGRRLILQPPANTPVGTYDIRPQIEYRRAGSTGSYNHLTTEVFTYNVDAAPVPTWRLDPQGTQTQTIGSLSAITYTLTRVNGSNAQFPNPPSGITIRDIHGTTITNWNITNPVTTGNISRITITPNPNAEATTYNITFNIRQTTAGGREGDQERRVIINSAPPMLEDLIVGFRTDNNNITNLNELVARDGTTAGGTDLGQPMPTTANLSTPTTGRFYLFLVSDSSITLTGITTDGNTEPLINGGTISGRNVYKIDILRPWSPGADFTNTIVNYG